MADQNKAATPAATWRADGEPDPHGERYDCERSALCMGDMTDDELANAVFMHGNENPSMQAMIGGALPAIAYLTAAKDRIRWLSRALVAATQAAAPAVPAVDALTDARILAIRREVASRYNSADDISDSAACEFARAIARDLIATPSTAPDEQKQDDSAHVLPPVAAPVSQHDASSAVKDQAMVDLMPKRAAFLAWAKTRALDVTEDRDAWGERKFHHSHVQALWDGWFNAPATYTALEQSITAGPAKGGITKPDSSNSLANPADAGAVAVEQAKPEGWKHALHAAVSAIYFDDSSDYKSALESVVHHLNAELASELLGNPRAAYDKACEILASQPHPLGARSEQHPDDIAVDKFAAAMKDKMTKSRAKGRGGWDNPEHCSADLLRAMLLDHIHKGDPVDVGNFAMMLFNLAEGATPRRAADASEQMGGAQVAKAEIPEGWPTNAMLQAGWKAGLSGKIGSGFRAMVAAAPTLGTVELVDCGSCGCQVSVPVSYFANPPGSAAAPADLPVFAYFKEVHTGWPEFNKRNEFSDGSAGEALVKLADVQSLLSKSRTAEGEATSERKPPDWQKLYTDTLGELLICKDKLANGPLMAAVGLGAQDDAERYQFACAESDRHHIDWSASKADIDAQIDSLRAPTPKEPTK